MHQAPQLCCGSGVCSPFAAPSAQPNRIPDDDDIACLAGLISAAIVDSDEEESDPQPEPQPEPAAESYSSGYNDGYDDAYAEAYEEGYEEAANSAGPVVQAEVLKELAQQSLSKKKDEKVVMAAAVPAAAV